jgi:plasmid stability protein
MILTINLPDEQESALRAKAEAQGVSAEQCAQQLLKQALSSEGRKPLAARIREIWADMPDEVRAEYPEGGARQIDHHVYGLPKR